MKFQKGLLQEIAQQTAEEERAAQQVASDTPVAKPVLGDVEKNRLFETLKEETGSERNYLKLLGIVAVFIVAAGAVIFYMTLPGFGDSIRAPKGLEEAVRDHFLVVEKRTATDISFYNCDAFIGARVNVEVRPDIKTNPVYLIPLYTARAIPRGESAWTITASPVTSREMDVPCN